MFLAAAYGWMWLGNRSGPLASEEQAPIVLRTWRETTPITMVLNWQKRLVDIAVSAARANSARKVPLPECERPAMQR
jgi:hypothetical protein